jgi:hypothetical protein
MTIHKHSLIQHPGRLLYFEICQHTQTRTSDIRNPRYHSNSQAYYTIPLYLPLPDINTTTVTPHPTNIEGSVNMIAEHKLISWHTLAFAVAYDKHKDYQRVHFQRRKDFNIDVVSSIFLRTLVSTYQTTEPRNHSMKVLRLLLCLCFQPFSFIPYHWALGT